MAVHYTKTLLYWLASFLAVKTIFPVCGVVLYGITGIDILALWMSGVYLLQTYCGLTVTVFIVTVSIVIPPTECSWVLRRYFPTLALWTRKPLHRVRRLLCASKS